jgi:DNA-binding transcriptional regulator LsrR (DeoR family)
VARGTATSQATRDSGPNRAAWSYDKSDNRVADLGRQLGVSDRTAERIMATVRHEETVTYRT